MKKYEMIQKASFSMDEVKQLLTDRYQKQLEGLCVQWGFADMAGTLAVQAIDNVIASMDDIQTQASMEWFCIHTLRSLVLEKLGRHQIQPDIKDSLFTGEIPARIDWNDKMQCALNVVLSSLNRREFYYMMRRYYFFETVYDEKIEQKIMKLF